MSTIKWSKSNVSIVKAYIQLHITTILLVLVMVSAIVVMVMENISHNNKIESSKIAMNKIIKENESLVEKAEAKSAVEMLEFRAGEANYFAGLALDNIEAHRLRILDEQLSYEHYILVRECSLEQINRKSRGLDYHIDYCNDDEVLDTFRTVK